MVGVNSSVSTIGKSVEATSDSNTHNLQPVVPVLNPGKPLSYTDIVARYSSQRYQYDDKEVALYIITPQDIAEGKTPIIYHKLYSSLRKKIVRASNSGLVNTAQILMKLHESPAQSLKSLQKLTYLSEDGITKRITAMKKFGFIVRASGRRLLLTGEARQMLEAARY